MRQLFNKQLTRNLLRVGQIICHSLECSVLFRARQHMVDDFGKGQLNEKLLFHGTEATFAHDICSEGFDWRLCGRNGTVYGKG